MRQIKLKRTPTGWNAQFLNDPDMVMSFGTDTIPTAFTEKAHSQRVLETISRLNPNHVVSIEGR